MMPETVAIITARSDSRRLPAKHLRMVRGAPMLSYLIRRLAAMPAIDLVVLASTDRSCDDELCRMAESYGAELFRGDCDDVVGRVAAAARTFSADRVVKANGDNPLQAPEIISAGIVRLREGDVELVTGKSAYTGLPVGLGAEVLTRQAIERLDQETPPPFREDITRYVYEGAAPWRWAPIPYPDAWTWPDGALTIDTEDDLRRFAEVIEALPNVTPEQWTMDMILEAMKRK